MNPFLAPEQQRNLVLASRSPRRLEILPKRRLRLVSSRIP